VATAFVNDIEQLMILTPYLDAALAADEGGPAEAERVIGGTDPAMRIPVDAATLQALAALAKEVPRTAAWAALVVAEQPKWRTVEGHLRHFPRWHERMLVTAATAEAAMLAGVAETLLSQVRLALGLRTPARRLGQLCPLHDDPAEELILPGDEADPVVTRGQITGIVWTRHDRATCSHCGASWAPGELLALSRLLRAADERRSGAGVAA